jgi:hypothetical protein
MLIIIREAVDPVGDWRLWAPVISAVATSAAVLVALFGEPLWRHWTRPRLRVLGFDLAEADGVEFRSSVENLEQAWVRLRVENYGRASAEMVEVTIERVEMLGDGPGDQEREHHFKRQELHGSVGNRLKWADRKSATINIPAGTSRRIDFVYLSTDEPNFRTASFDVALPMRLVLERRGEGMERHILPQLAYRIWVIVGGMNFKPVNYSVDVHFGGTWIRGSEIWEPEFGGLRIEDPRRVGLRRRRKMQKL